MGLFAISAAIFVCLAMLDNAGALLFVAFCEIHAKPLLYVRRLYLYFTPATLIIGVQLYTGSSIQTISRVHVCLFVL